MELYFQTVVENQEKRMLGSILFASWTSTLRLVFSLKYCSISHFLKCEGSSSADCSRTVECFSDRKKKSSEKTIQMRLASSEQRLSRWSKVLWKHHSAGGWNTSFWAYVLIYVHIRCVQVHHAIPDALMGF